MAVYRLYKNKAFEPEAISMMTDAYTDVCRRLGLSDRDQTDVNAVAKTVVAKTVIEYAQRGVRDPAHLRDHVLQALQD
jgi:hypothetical protein